MPWIPQRDVSHYLLKMLKTMQFNKDRMEESAKHGFTNATDAADYLVNHGVPFRDAHGIVGKLVLTCIEKKIPLDALPLEEYKKISPVFEEDIYEAIDLKTCVNKRITIGGARERMRWRSRSQLIRNTWLNKNKRKGEKRRWRRN